MQSTHPQKYDKLCDHIIDNLGAWEDFAASNEPQNETLPEPWNDSLDHFEKLLILKIFRPEKLMFAFTDYVKEELGTRYIEN